MLWGRGWAWIAIVDDAARGGSAEGAPGARRCSYESSPRCAPTLTSQRERWLSLPKRTSVRGDCTKKGREHNTTTGGCGTGQRPQSCEHAGPHTPEKLSPCESTLYAWEPSTRTTHARGLESREEGTSPNPTLMPHLCPRDCKDTHGWGALALFETPLFTHNRGWYGAVRHLGRPSLSVLLSDSRLGTFWGVLGSTEVISGGYDYSKPSQNPPSSAARCCTRSASHHPSATSLVPTLPLCHVRR